MSFEHADGNYSLLAVWFSLWVFCVDQLWFTFCEGWLSLTVGQMDK
jgi:hypothetical protein